MLSKVGKSIKLNFLIKNFFIQITSIYYYFALIIMEELVFNN